MAELDGKRALVTGGAQGLGKAIAALFIKRGAQVMISDIDEGGVKLTADELGENCRAVKCDVTSAAEVPLNERLTIGALSRAAPNWDEFALVPTEFFARTT